MSHNSFDTYPLNEIFVARDNLAEAAAFVFQDDKMDTHHRFHVIGNLMLATAATSERLSSTNGLVQDLEEVLVAGGLSLERAVDLATTTGKLSRHIFPLMHIPNEAPEIVIGRHSRELNVGKFVAEARKLNPSRQPDPSLAGFGKQMFIGSYSRKLS